MPEQVRKQLRDLVRVSGGGAFRTVDDGERVFENGGEREGVVDTAVLEFAINGGESAGDGRRSDSDAGEAVVDCERRRHWILFVCLLVRE